LDDLVASDVVRVNIAESTVAHAVRERLIPLEASELRSVVERQPSHVLAPFALSQLAAGVPGGRRKPEWMGWCFLWLSASTSVRGWSV
jgi:hypothetical protein